MVARCWWIQLSTGDLSALAKLLARPPAGIRLVGKGRLTTSSLSTAQWNFGDDQQGGVELRLASRVEPSLGLKLWLQARVKLGKGAAPVELQIDGAPIPPEEAVVAASKAPKDGQAAPAPCGQPRLRSVARYVP